MKKIFLFLIVFVAIKAMSQSPNIMFLSTTFNWGDMISTQFPPTAFRFVNLSTKPLTILNTHSDYEVKVSYAHTYIAPHDTGIVYVKYESNTVGKFSKNIEVNFNISMESYKLTVSGNNVSVISCYPDAKNWTIRKVCIIDSLTKEPIKDANCTFFCYTNGKNIPFVADKEGKKIVELPIGMYDISIKANGYKPLIISQNIPKTAPILFFEMAKSKVVTTVIKSQPISQSTTVVQQNSTPIPIVKKDPIKQSVDEPKPIVNNGSTEQIELPKDKYRSNNIVFLIDISKSMQSNKRLDKLKQCMNVLINALRDNDRVSIVVYNTRPKVLIETQNGQFHTILNAAIDTLIPTGFTNGVSGLETAYSFAQKYFVTKGNNQLLLATDGEFSGNEASEQLMKAMVADNANRGIVLSIVGYAETKEIIESLQSMALLGHGSFLQINEQLDQRLLIEEIKSKSLINMAVKTNY